MPRWINLVFGARIMTKDSYFVLNGCLEMLTEREASPGGEVLDLENFELSLHHNQPSQQLLSSCYAWPLT